MNDEKIEELLRKAPGVKTPAGLHQTLQGEIRLPQRGATDAISFAPRPWLRRWLPELSFAILFITCFVAIGVQLKVLSNMTVVHAGPVEPRDREQDRVWVEKLQLEHLRKDNADLHRLREEVNKLQADLGEVEKLRAENQKLQALNSAVATQSSAEGSLDDALEKEKAQAQAIQCVNNLKQIGLSERIWAQDNGGKFTSNFISMSNELSTPFILKCPTDKNTSATNFVDIIPANISYQMVSTDCTEDAADLSNLVLIQCPVHGTLLFADGHVESITPERRKQLQYKKVDGKTYLVP
jgi:prepilin-type processing-associated H-X9-DG protein